MEGERRQVTVLFSDIVGFTALSENLDPEQVHEIVDRWFGLIAAEVYRFEGTINQYTGDGMMALFGAPVAHEDAPRRAVHAALAIQRVLGEYGQDLEQRIGVKLKMRIGINTGTVVVGKIGDDLRMEYTALGDTINLASRLQSCAAPGGIIIGESTWKLASGFFECSDLGELQIKGHQPARGYEVLRARGRRARLDIAAERGLTPLVGRERELATLEELFQRVASGHGQVVFIAGEAGIGKSRLLLELRRCLTEANRDATVIEGRCVSFGQAIPMLPLIDQLRQNFQIDEGDGEPEVIAKVESNMSAMGGLEAEIPYIRYLLSVDPGDPRVTAIDAAERRTRMFSALRRLTSRGAGARPLILIVEDLHWADTSTQEYLRDAMDAAPRLPLMYILTYRIGYEPPFSARSFHTTLALHNLSKEDAFTMAARMLGAEHFPDELRESLVDKAEGVPLYVEEVTKTLVDLGLIEKRDGALHGVKADADIRVPDTIQEIIMTRLDRLGDDGKRAVQLASVIGRQFFTRLLERVAGFGGKLDGLLRELRELEIVYEQADAAEPAYVFKHAVIQDVAYQSLLANRRRELHRAVGAAIAELYADRPAEHYGELAHHYTRAEMWPDAARFSELAGDLAAQAFANVEARKHYSNAFEAAAHAAPSLAPEWLATLHAKSGAVLLVLGDYEASVAQYQAALGIARKLGDRRREMEILMWLGSVYDYSHQGEPAIAHNEQALAIARELQDAGFESICLANRVEMKIAGWGQIAESIADVEQALRLSPEIKDVALLAKTLAYVGGAWQWHGDYDRALPHLRRAVEVAQDAHAGFIFGFGAFHIALLMSSTGNYEDSLRWLARLKEYADAAGDRFWIARVDNLIAGVHLELSDLDEAIERNLEADEIAKRVWAWPEPRGHSLLKAGLGFFGKGDHGKAHQQFMRAWDLLEEDNWYRWRWHIPLLAARGQLALAEKRFDDAWKFADESLAMATATDSRKHIARAHQLRSRSWPRPEGSKRRRRCSESRCSLRLCSRPRANSGRRWRRLDR